MWRASAAALIVSALAASGCGGSSPKVSAPVATIARHPAPGPSTSSAVPAPKPLARHRRRSLHPIRSGPPYAVAEKTVTFVDTSRLVDLPGLGRQPRRLVTVVRYPVHGAGRFPLVIFGHGFAVSPAPYSQLLQAWARAGYVVAAPVFPLENAAAPGGPDESDLVNQPADMSFVITRMTSRFAGILQPGQVAVTGQSDGGETALAVAYDRHFIDRRVKAAVILSGAVIPGVGGFDFPAPSPPLLATQGTADTINPPGLTHAFFDIAPRPKYLLTMFGAPHLPPYTGQQPQLGIVERVTIAFMNRYLKRGPGGTRPIAGAGDMAGVAALTADP